MTGKKLYYSIFVIILTIITVIVILQLQIKNYTPNPEIFDKLDTNEKYAEVNLYKSKRVKENNQTAL